MNNEEKCPFPEETSPADVPAEASADTPVDPPAEPPTDALGEPSAETAPTPAPKKKCWRILLIVLLALAVLITAVAVAIDRVPDAVIEENVQPEEPLQEEEVEVTPDLPPAAKVHNIALFGIDQEHGSVGRSDALLILSIDRTNNKVKLTSLDRDSLVAIEGHGEEKLTHAWAYGHGKLAVKTLNQNFGMNITDYAYVNFGEFVDAIDYLGGVYVDVTTAEKNHMNQAWESWVVRYGWDTPKVEQTGRVLLNGGQALTYSRNRSDGSGRRAERQREVLMAMFEQVKAQPLSKLPATLSRLLKLCHTNLSGDEIADIAMWALTKSPTVETLSLPTSELKPWGGVIDTARGWVRVYDLEAATVLLHNFIYETDDPVTEPTETTKKTKKTTTSAAAE